MSFTAELGINSGGVGDCRKPRTHIMHFKRKYKGEVKLKGRGVLTWIIEREGDSISMLLNGKRRFVTLLPEGDNVRGGGCRESRYLRTAVLMKRGNNNSVC